MEAFLAGLWNRLNRPIHFLLVGAAIAWFAPGGTSWIGYIFIAFGTAGLLEWLWKRWLYNLIFIEQSGVWSYEPNAKRIIIQALLRVTNRNEDDVVIFSRVTLRRAGIARLLRSTEWRDCSRIEVGGQIFLPAAIGPTLEARSTAVMSVLHDHPASQQVHARRITFILRIRDHRRRYHRMRLHLMPHPSVSP
jgi:hypothetical protein